LPCARPVSPSCSPDVLRPQVAPAGFIAGHDCRYISPVSSPALAAGAT
jgi:hypothetical protein